MRGLLQFAAPLALVLAPAPASAQEQLPDAGDLAGLGALMGMFTPEPLTAEQQERLPAAERVMALVMPEGSLQDVMGGMFDRAIPLREVVSSQPSASSVLAQQLGLGEWELSLSEEQATTAAALLDPVWAERARREAELAPRMMENMMAAMEPAMRQAMAEAYAINFTAAELADIEAFFATPSGQSYARKSMTLGSDPRIAAATLTMMPAMMESFATMEADMAAATADLPPVRRFEDLSETEQKQVARLVGLSVEELASRREGLNADGEWEELDDGDPYLD